MIEPGWRVGFPISAETKNGRDIGKNRGDNLFEYRFF